MYVTIVLIICHNHESLIALMVSGKNLIAPCVMDFHRVTTLGHPNDITAANNCPAFMFKVPKS